MYEGFVRESLLCIMIDKSNKMVIFRKRRPNISF